MTASLTGAQLLVASLAKNGVDTVFGMPGGQTAGIYNALFGQQAVRQVLVRNEQAGAFMADAYSRATGRPGVCLVTAGPGLTNTATALGTAYSDSIPMLVISGQIPRQAIGTGRGYYHEMDNLGFTSSLTKWSAAAQSADDIPGLVDRAFLEMATGRPRPVHLDIPIDVVDELSQAMPQAAQPPITQRPSASETELGEATDLLKNARRPLLIAGGGVVSADACAELIELATSLGAPILTTPMGKGSVPDDHPLSAGMTFHRITSDLTGMKENLSPLTKHADVVLAVGCRFSQLATGNWDLELPGSLVQIDIDEQELGLNYPTTVGLCADAKMALSTLRSSLLGHSSQAAESAWKTVRCNIPEVDRWQIDGFDLAPILRRVLDRDAIVACDITRLYYMMLANFPVYTPRTFLHPSCFIPMGYGLPAAIGAKAAFPDRQVIAIAGDGGFMMTAQELACAVQAEIHVVTILVNDNCLSAMKGIQNRRYGGKNIAVDLVNPDFVQFAESFGALGLRVQKLEEFEPALRAALSAGRPAVIEVQAPGTAM